MYGRYGLPREENVEKRVKEIKENKYDEEFEKTMSLKNEELRSVYTEHQRTREVY